MGLVQSKEKSALVKQNSFRRIEVLWIAIVNNTASKTANPTTFIHNWNHDPIAESVIFPLALLSFHHQTAFQQKLSINTTLSEGGGELVPGIWSKTKVKLFYYIVVYTTMMEIFQTGGAIFCHCQTIMEEFASQLMGLTEFFQLLLPGYFLWGPLSLGQGNIQLLRLKYDGLPIGKAFYHRYKLKNIPTCVTTETVKKSLIRGHCKGRRFFIVKRAAAPKLFSFALQRYISGDHRNKI